uniref:WAS/WASL-interacting protein family member 2-like isoform X2 n=1 Tax=Myxine glutinosa TaxID=7769 RepID=UPI00358EAB86
MSVCVSVREEDEARVSYLDNNMRASQRSRSESKGRAALFVDIHKGANLKKAVTNDRSAPLLESAAASPSPALPLSARFTGPILSPRPFGSANNFRSTPSSSIRPYAGPKSTLAGPAIYQRPLSASRRSTTCPSSDGHDHSNVGSLMLHSRPNCSNPPPAAPHLPPSLDCKPSAFLPARPLARYQSPNKPQTVFPRGFKPRLSSSPSRVSTYSISSPSPFEQQLPRSIDQHIKPPPVPRHGPCVDHEGPPTLGHREALFARWQCSRNGPPLPPPHAHHSTPPTVPILDRCTGPPAPLLSYEHESRNHPGGAAPLLPQRQNSLLQSIGKGPAAYPLSPSPGSRPPPPAREPPHLSGPPAVIRNGLAMNQGPLPAPPLPLRQHSMEPPSPDGTDRTRMAPGLPSPVVPGRPRVGHCVPPPLPPRNGPIRPFSTIDDFESRFNFHSISDFPPPEAFQTHQRSYPSTFHRNEFVRSHRDALPPVPRLR